MKELDKLKAKLYKISQTISSRTEREKGIKGGLAVAIIELNKIKKDL